MGRTILLIHGVGCTGEAWQRVAGALQAAGHETHAPTLYPEFRVAQNPTGQLSQLSLNDYVEQAAGWSRDILRRTGEPPVVIGHSMGGLIAQKLAERGQAQGAILVTPAQPVDCRVPDLRVLWTFANIVVQGRPERAYKVWRTGFEWGVLNRVEPERRDAIYAMAVYDSGLVYRDLADPQKDPHRIGVIEERLVRCPVLTIGAVDDRATPVQAVRRVAAKYARIGGDYREYDRAAHYIIDEPRTDAMIADILAWMSRRLD